MQIKCVAGWLFVAELCYRSALQDKLMRCAVMCAVRLTLGYFCACGATQLLVLERKIFRPVLRTE